MAERCPRARRGRLATVLATVALVLGACGDGTDRAIDRAPAPDPPVTSPDTEPAPADGHPSPPAGPGAGDDATEPDPTEPIEISLRLDRRIADPATDTFDEVVRSTLTDARGWEQAGFRFRFDQPDAPYVVVLAEGSEVDALCDPYDTGGRYSCQIGPVVALNADRWREATPQWTGDLATYRQMLVNHEVGHLLGQNHPTAPCPAPGEPAPVMTQQSTNLQGCLPNPWPLPWELRCAAIRDLRPIAPPFERVDGPLCGPDGPTG
jgi:hypothetical protein